MEEIVRVYVGDLVLQVVCSQQLKTTQFQKIVLREIFQRNPELPTDPNSYTFIQTNNGRFLHKDLICEHKDSDKNLEVSLICTNNIPKEILWKKQQLAKHFVDGLQLGQEESEEVLESFKEDLIKTTGDICYLQEDDLKRLHLDEVKAKIQSHIVELKSQLCIHINCPTCAKDPEKDNQDSIKEDMIVVAIDGNDKVKESEDKSSEAPKFQKPKRTRDLSEFPERNYNVVKINLMGRRQNRILRLTNTEISNIRSGKITANHGYKDVTCVILQDAQTFMVSFVNDHDFTYAAPNAMDIVYEINERLAARRNREKSLFTYNLVKIPMKYQAKIFGEEGGKFRKRGSGKATGKLDAEQNEQLLGVLRGPTTEARSKVNISKAAAKTASKLAALTGSTQNQRIQHYVERVILDPKTEEGRARVRFFKNFSNIEKEPHTILGVIRQFMDSVRLHIENKHSKYLRSTMDTTNPLDDEVISKLIEESIQKAVVMHKYTNIEDALEKISQQRNAKIMNKKRILRSKQQEFYGIKKTEISSSNWSAAIYELDCMDKKKLPVEKLEVLLKTARAIYNTHNYERNRKEAEARSKDESGIINPKNFFLAADEFFPIFLYVVVNSNINCLDFTKQFLWGLCERGSLTGEGGYYLTVFEATVEYIHSFDIKTASTKSQSPKNTNESSIDTRFSACE